MSDIRKFVMSKDVLNNMLDNCFGTPSLTFTDTTIYVGLGIDFDEQTFTFTDEPVAMGYTINPTPVVFTAQSNATIRNSNAIEWAKAKEDWTKDGQTINYIGLYYKLSDDGVNPVYQLMGVLPLTPAETIKKGEKMVLNANSIQIQLNNK